MANPMPKNSDDRRARLLARRPPEVLRLSAYPSEASRADGSRQGKDAIAGTLRANLARRGQTILREESVLWLPCAEAQSLRRHMGRTVVDGRTAYYSPSDLIERVLRIGATFALRSAQDVTHLS